MMEVFGLAALLLVFALWSYLDDLGEARKTEAQARLEGVRSKDRATPTQTPDPQQDGGQP